MFKIGSIILALIAMVGTTTHYAFASETSVVPLCDTNGNGNSNSPSGGDNSNSNGNGNSNSPSGGGMNMAQSPHVFMGSMNAGSNDYHGPIMYENHHYRMMGNWAKHHTTYFNPFEQFGGEGLQGIPLGADDGGGGHERHHHYEHEIPVDPFGLVHGYSPGMFREPPDPTFH